MSLYNVDDIEKAGSYTENNAYINKKNDKFTCVGVHVFHICYYHATHVTASHMSNMPVTNCTINMFRWTNKVPDI